jgi:hypothetical protein
MWTYASFLPNPSIFSTHITTGQFVTYFMTGQEVIFGAFRLQLIGIHPVVEEQASSIAVHPYFLSPIFAVLGAIKGHYLCS